MKNLSKYSRQVILPEIGDKGQAKIRAAKILIIGAGGLSCPAVQYLVAAGVGQVTLIDPDIIESSNLHRQILYSEEDTGEYKAVCAARKLAIQNPDVQINSITDHFKTENAIQLVKLHDLIIDGSDNFSTRYLINDACVIVKKPFIYASLRKFDLQLSLFDGRYGPTYRCLFPEPPEDIPNCSEEGIIGSVAGIAGALQATEALKYIAGVKGSLKGKLFNLNLLNYKQACLTINTIEDNLKIKVLKDAYGISCEKPVKYMTHEMARKEKILWIDIRDTPSSMDIDQYNIKTDDPLEIETLSHKQTVLLYCDTGRRSKELAERLTGNKNIYTLKGGLLSIDGLEIKS